MALTKRQLRIWPGAKPGVYRFAINDDDITPLVKQAKIELSNQASLKTKLSIATPVDTPDDIVVILFTGEKPNGYNRSY
jgi:hypothetical protein